MPEKGTSLNNRLDEASEELLIRRVRDGEHDALCQLIRPYERRVYAAAFAITHNLRTPRTWLRRRC